jgi:hypothetical protein
MPYSPLPDLWLLFQAPPQPLLLPVLYRNLPVPNLPSPLSQPLWYR